MNTETTTLMRPAQFAEHTIITSILNNTYPPGTTLPSERVLAEQLGVTRPTIRETLQRLATERWVKIQHGRSTIVNDFWKDGGLGMLGTMARYADFLPNGFITSLLEVRLNLLPECGQAAADRAPDILLSHLAGADALDGDAQAFADFDWQLQVLVVRHCGNRIYSLIMNDFKDIYKRLASGYFMLPEARDSSFNFYRALDAAIRSERETVFNVVRDVMKESIAIWKKIRST